MTGTKALNTALQLMGYVDPDGNPEFSKRLRGSAVALLNSVYGDLWCKVSDEPFVPITSAAEEIPLEEQVMQLIFPYGLAMMIARNESDGDSFQLWSSLFDNRQALLSTLSSFEDVLPGGMTE